MLSQYDPDDELPVSGRQSNHNVYHTFEDCQHITEKNREWQVKLIEKMDYDMCKRCEARGERDE